MNKILSKLYICFVIVLLFIWCVPFAFAAENTGTLRIYLKSMDSEEAICDAKVQIYKIADYDVENTVLTQDFALSGISINTLKNDPNSCVDLLDNFVSNSEVKPYLTATTDNTGLAEFTSLNDGIYFVQKTQESDTDYSMKPFVVAVPSLNDGDLIREITCKPKCERSNLADISVTKVWKDSTDKERPKSVVILLFGGNELLDTVKLSEENGWTYEWKNMNARCKYYVKEMVPTGYTASIKETDKNIFVVTNTKDKPVSGFLPQTGQLWWPVPVLLTIGLLMLILGWSLNCKDSRKKRFR